MAGPLEGTLSDAGLVFLDALFFGATFLADPPAALFFAAFLPAGLFATAFFFAVFFPATFFFAGFRTDVLAPELFFIAMPYPPSVNGTQTIEQTCIIQRRGSEKIVAKADQNARRKVIKDNKEVVFPGTAEQG